MNARPITIHTTKSVDFSQVAAGSYVIEHGMNTYNIRISMIDFTVTATENVYTPYKDDNVVHGRNQIIKSQVEMKFSTVDQNYNASFVIHNLFAGQVAESKERALVEVEFRGAWNPANETTVFTDDHHFIECRAIDDNDGEDVYPEYEDELFNKSPFSLDGRNMTLKARDAGIDIKFERIGGQHVVNVFIGTTNYHITTTGYTPVDNSEAVEYIKTYNRVVKHGLLGYCGNINKISKTSIDSMKTVLNCKSSWTVIARNNARRAREDRKADKEERRERRAVRRGEREMRRKQRVRDEMNERGRRIMEEEVVNRLKYDPNGHNLII